VSSSNRSGLVVPPEYQGREQSYLKHRVLNEYLVSWGHKLGSAGRQRGRTKLWYVDTFAGPWDERQPDLADTSIAIGLGALETAAATWKERGHVVEVAALFVEKKAEAFAKLEKYLAERNGTVATRAFRGEFGDHAAEIQRCLGGDAAFIFVDPLGWKGAAMKYIAPLVGGRAPRDVLINVMFDHLNRQKDRLLEHIREQMRDFFGLKEQELPPDLDEEALFDLYRSQLKAQCKLLYAADLAIPHPTMERTKFRLVVGGKSPAVMEVFRDVEARILGREAAAVREEARRRDREAKTRQLSLLSTPPEVDRPYEIQHAMDVKDAEDDVLRSLSQTEEVAFRTLWPLILEKRHVTLSELRQIVATMRKAERIQVSNATSGERTTKDDHLLSLP